MSANIITALATNPLPARPTVEQIDELAAKYFLADKAFDEALKVLDDIEAECIALVEAHGIVPPNAENSRKLEGRYYELQVTTGNTTTVDEVRVGELLSALEANERGEVFPNLFGTRIRHEAKPEGEDAILAAGLTKRLTEKVMTLYRRCFEVKRKKPSLKVKQIVEKPAKKSRAKKGAEVARG